MGIEVIAYSDGFKTDINENESFLGILGNLDNEEGDQCLEEYFHNVVYIYKNPGYYYVYFTVEHNIDAIDGYIVKSESREELFRYIAEKRNNEYIIEELVENYSL